MGENKKNPGPAGKVRELTDDELEQAAGGSTKKCSKCGARLLTGLCHACGAMN